MTPSIPSCLGRIYQLDGVIIGISLKMLSFSFGFPQNSQSHWAWFMLAHSRVAYGRRSNFLSMLVCGISSTCPAESSLDLVVQRLFVHFLDLPGMQRWQWCWFWWRIFSTVQIISTKLREVSNHSSVAAFWLRFSTISRTRSQDLACLKGTWVVTLNVCVFPQG